MIKNKPLLLFVLLLFITSIVHSIHFYITPVSAILLSSLRWVLLSSFAFYCIKKKSLTTWIFFSMLAGIEVGFDFPEIAANGKIISKIFLRLIKTIIAPLVFATLVSGIAGHSDSKQVGRLGWKSILYFEIVTTIALVIGLTAINISKAGVGVLLPPSSEKIEVQQPKTFTDHIIEAFPENIAKSVSEGHVLQIVVFSILFGMGLSRVSAEHKKHVLQLVDGLAEVMFKFTEIIMYAAPFAVFGAMAYTVGHMGLGVLKSLFLLLATLYAALFVLILGVFLPIALFAKIPIIPFIKAIAEPVSIAFATTSSESALPKLMKALEHFGVPRKIVSFVLPMGYSFNLDGTTLYLSLATIFLAQVGSIDLSIPQQITILLTLMLTSKGVAGVPRASLVILMGTAATFGLPTEPIFIILGIDELMDMARTAVNIIGNSLATVVIAKWEGEFEAR